MAGAAFTLLDTTGEVAGKDVRARAAGSSSTIWPPGVYRLKETSSG
ncbi:hypothetical protein [Streptomyces niveus]|nr:hypothetical protein [Streptomyces niveus]EST32363.1 hypothetical protein M877_04635 [Streptomyces niveus NCIMB 11891]